MARDVEKALTLIDEAHSADPNKTESGEAYELHYARMMTDYLQLHTPNANPLLQVAIRAQHFRRWEIPRDTYPRTRPGYFAWRNFQKKRAGEQVKEICLECDFSEDEADRVSSLIAKEDLKKGDGNGDPDVQVLEDCACLVFLDDQFDKFEAEMKKENQDDKDDGDQKIISILQKTWIKMGKRGQELALQMDLSDRAKELVGQALAG